MATLKRAAFTLVLVIGFVLAGCQSVPAEPGVINDRE